MRILLLIISVMLVSCKPRFIQNADLENKIFSSIEIAKDSFTIGEAILIEFIVLNKSDREIFIDNSSNEVYINGSKYGGFDVIVQNEKGEVIKPNPDQLSALSGRYGITKVSPLKTCVFRFYLSKYADIKQIGKYNLVVNKKLYIYLDKRSDKKWGNTSRAYKNFYVSLKSEIGFQVTDN